MVSERCNDAGLSSGTVYTKAWVVDFMLDRVGYTADRDLASLKVLEPSCGCGAFLGTIVRRLCSSAHRHGRFAEDLVGCILGVDIDPGSIAACRDSIACVLISEGFSREDSESLARSWTSCGDFLLGSYTGYDIVIGNPPYIRSEGLSEESRRAYADKLKTVTMGTDLFVGFIENGLDCLSATGKLCFICADRWMQNRYGSSLRQLITEQYSMELICRMHGVDAFESEVSAYPAVTIIGKDRSAGCRYAVCREGFDGSHIRSLESALDGSGDAEGPFSVSDISVGGRGPWVLAEPQKASLVEEFRLRFPTIEDSGVRIGIGVATGRDSVFITDREGLVEPDRMLPLIMKRDIRGGSMPPAPMHWLVNPWDDEGRLIELAEHPMTRSYLESNRDSLMSRHVAKKDASKWYRTIDKVNPLLRAMPKLLMQDMSPRPDPYYDDGRFYPCHNMYWLASDRWDMKVLGGILISDQIESFIDAVCVKMRGNTMRCQAQYIRMLHIPYPESLSESDNAAFRTAFDTRDRKMATLCMGRLLDRRPTIDERGHEKSVVEIV